MGDVKLYTIIVSLFIFIGIVVGGMIFIAPILSASSVTYSSDESAIEGNMSILRDTMSVFYEDLSKEQLNSSAKSGDGNNYNLGAVGSVLEFIKNLGNILTSLINVLKLTFSDLPSWIWWLIGSLIGFTGIWKLLEAWLGHNA